MNSINEKALEVAKKIADNYATSTNTLGILLIGSAASDSMDDRSDVDLLCVTKTSDSLSRESFVDAGSGLPFEILFNTAGELHEYLCEENGSVYRTIAHMISTGKPIYNPDDQLDELMAKAEKVIASSVKTTENQSIMIRYSIEDFLSDAQREFEKHNMVTFMMYGERLIANVTEAVLRKNNGYFRPPGQLMDYLKTHDSDLDDLLQVFYYCNNDDNTKLMTLESIAEHGLRQLGGGLSSEWQLVVDEAELRKEVQ